MPHSIRAGGSITHFSKNVAMQENGIRATMRGTQARIVTLKQDNPFLKGVYSKVLQIVNSSLWSNIAALSQIKKAKSKLEKAYDHITNQKRDFLHKLSRSYIDRYRTICIEDLDIKGLKEKGSSKGLHRSIHDVSWGRFYSFLDYKAESAGIQVIKVDPRNTSQMCANCGSIVKKILSVRGHECP